MSLTNHEEDQQGTATTTAVIDGQTVEVELVDVPLESLDEVLTASQEANKATNGNYDYSEKGGQAFRDGLADDIKNSNPGKTFEKAEDLFDIPKLQSQIWKYMTLEGELNEKLYSITHDESLTEKERDELSMEVGNEYAQVNAKRNRLTVMLASYRFQGDSEQIKKYLINGCIEDKTMAEIGEWYFLAKSANSHLSQEVSNLKEAVKSGTKTLDDVASKFANLQLDYGSLELATSRRIGEQISLIHNLQNTNDELQKLANEVETYKAQATTEKRKRAGTIGAAIFASVLSLAVAGGSLLYVNTKQAELDAAATVASNYETAQTQLQELRTKVTGLETDKESLEGQLESAKGVAAKHMQRADEMEVALKGKFTVYTTSTKEYSTLSEDGGALFESASFELTPEAKGLILGESSDLLEHVFTYKDQQHTLDVIGVDGHTDEKPVNKLSAIVKTTPHNDDLSEKRAYAAAYEISMENPEAFVLYKGFGSREPVTDDNGEIISAKSRRVALFRANADLLEDRANVELPNTTEDLIEFYISEGYDVMHRGEVVTNTFPELIEGNKLLTDVYAGSVNSSVKENPATEEVAKKSLSLDYN